MEDERVTSQPVNSGAASAPAPTLPDINAETYPFDVVQQMLDQAAYFNMYSVTDGKDADCRIATGSQQNAIGFRVSEKLHRFQIKMFGQSEDTGRLRATNKVGEQIGRFESRWLMMPHDFVAAAGVEPPPTLFDPQHSQRFVMLDGVCKFGDGEDGFQGFGTGLTYPSIKNGSPTSLVAAVGNITKGFGKFEGHEGTYTYCGSLSAQQGFRGSLMCRVMDPEGTLSSELFPSEIETGPAIENGITYLLFRGQKRDRTQKTSYRFGPNGEVTGLDVKQQLRNIMVDAGVRGRKGLRSTTCIGQVIGSMKAAIIFNLLNPGAPGTGDAPIPFQSYNEYTFFDRNENPIGTIIADGGEGRTFNMQLKGLPGQSALRFGGFGPIVQATGQFAGIEGLMTDNSVVGVAPHALATSYVLRIIDPDGRFRGND